MKISKHRRMTKIMQTLHRWGPLDLNELNSRLEKTFSVERDSLKRNIQNDLKFLRDEGEVVAYYYDKFGKFISSDLPPTGDSFYRLKWQTQENENYKISGLKELETFKGSLLFNSQASQILSIRQGPGTEDPGKKLIYFELNHDLYHLQLDCPAINKVKGREIFFELGIGRLKSLDSEKIKWHHTSSHAKAILTLPDPYLSSLEIQEPPPLCIAFFTDSSIDLIHHSNKNSPRSTSISDSLMGKILTDLSFFKDQTKTKHWTDLTTSDQSEFNHGSQANQTTPFLIKIQDRSGFIIS